MAVFYILRWVGWWARWYCCIIIYIQCPPIVCSPLSFLTEPPFCLGIHPPFMHPTGASGKLTHPQVGGAWTHQFKDPSLLPAVGSEKGMWSNCVQLNLARFAEVFREAPFLRRELQEASLCLCLPLSGSLPGPQRGSMQLCLPTVRGTALKSKQHCIWQSGEMINSVDGITLALKPAPLLLFQKGSQ